MKFELQLWSISELTQKSFPDALSKVSEWGYSGVEFAGFGGLDSAQMKNLLDTNGLYSPGAHIPVSDFENNFDEMLEYCHNLGMKYMIIPFAEIETEEDIAYIADLLNRCGDKAAKYGMKTGYHNHSGEMKFIGNRRILDALAEDTNDNVVIEPDVFWVKYAGVDPVEYIKKLGKKAEIIHLKQISADGKTNVAFPDGILDMKEIIDASSYAKYFVVEQEGSVDRVEASRVNAEVLGKF